NSAAPKESSAGSCEAIRRMGLAGSKMLFTAQYGAPVEPHNPFRSFVDRIEKAGMRRISDDDDRGTYASLRADLDVHARVAMQIVRHADFKVTMEIYTQASSTQTREAYRRQRGRLRPPETAPD